LKIDIAIDLNGYTSQGRTGIFSYRAAPIQVSYIGYLGTMGAKYFDYLIADEIIIPTDSQKYYSEKIIYLPSYQVNDSQREISDKIFNRAELGISENCFIYCCFNNTFKINPFIYEIWIRILHAVPNSVMILFCDNNHAKQNLKKEAEIRGVSSSRLLFAERLVRSEYLARYKMADLFLDTFPYNAGTTASDALWAGLPVLTLMGESFSSRVAASLLYAIDLPELITKSAIDYENMAINLAVNTSLLNKIKNRLINNKNTTRLFDSKHFTKSLESAYLEVYRRYQQNLAPANIHIN
jgi:predicted O-linked N-acetylglucosamine transferase (SPINDLY family)